MLLLLNFARWRLQTLGKNLSDYEISRPQTTSTFCRIYGMRKIFLRFFSSECVSSGIGVSLETLWNRTQYSTSVAFTFFQHLPPPQLCLVLSLLNFFICKVVTPHPEHSTPTSWLTRDIFIVNVMSGLGCSISLSGWIVEILHWFLSRIFIISSFRRIFIWSEDGVKLFLRFLGTLETSLARTFYTRSTPSLNSEQFTMFLISRAFHTYQLT